MTALDKAEIRRTMLAQRRSFPEAQKTQAELQMFEFLQNWEIFKNSRVLHVFLSQTDEPDTRPIFKHSWISGKQIGVPCVLPETSELFHSQLNSFDDLRPGVFDIPEPALQSRIALSPQIFDLILIPGVAFERNGGRLGYGKGYYDRFLVQTKAFRLALAFDFQILENIPTEKHDVPMHGILSESGIHFCKGDRP